MSNLKGRVPKPPEVQYKLQKNLKKHSLVEQSLIRKTLDMNRVDRVLYSE